MLSKSKPLIKAEMASTKPRAIPTTSTPASARSVSAMSEHRIFSVAFASVYPAYVNKAERKGRTKEEVDKAICWLTGYTQAGLDRQLELKSDLRSFFDQAPALNPNRSKITGSVCGVRVETVEDPLMQKIRQLDRLIDELAKGKAMDKVLRA